MSDNSVAPSSILKYAKWFSSDPTVLKIENGQVIPLKKGVATLKAVINGIVTSVIVRVQSDVQDTGVIWQELEIYNWEDLNQRSWKSVSETIS